jgi:glyoxylase-like metal-dependent hydrolase (beta-lactamase superfamily II)
MTKQLYFRQWLAGRDFAMQDSTAAQMLNFVYAIGDTESREAVLVDPAWDTPGLLDLLAADDMKLTGVLATHYHPDHIGGSMFGMHVPGIAGLLEHVAVPIHVHAAEAAGVQVVTGVSDADLCKHQGGDHLQVGQVDIQLLHTPGHTPGSQCFLVDQRLVAGDTLFVQGCGRVDLPGGDSEEMYRTMTQRLAQLDDAIILYPGHHYGPAPHASLGAERQSNQALRVRSLQDWQRMMGV